MNLKRRKNAGKKSCNISKDDSQVEAEVGEEAAEVEVENVFSIESHTGTTKSITLRFSIFSHYALMPACQQ